MRSWARPTWPSRRWRSSSAERAAAASDKFGLCAPGCLRDSDAGSRLDRVSGWSSAGARRAEPAAGTVRPHEDRESAFLIFAANSTDPRQQGAFAERSNLGSRVYRHLSYQLMSARLKPGERLKIRALSQALDVSETPVREALLQLVREGALEMKEGYYIRVKELSLAEYLEIRDIRQELEVLAALRALPRLTEVEIAQLAVHHEKLVDAEALRAYDDALLHNYDFHFGIYRHSGMPQLTALLEKLWVQVGPLLNFLYPDGHPTYDGRHQHLNILHALREKDPEALRTAVVGDLLEGGRRLVELLERKDAERLAARR